MALKRNPLFYVVPIGFAGLICWFFVGTNPVSTGDIVPENRVIQPSAERASAGPKIVFNETELHLGSRPAGDKATGQFVFTNRGSETLVIESVRAG